jgi:tetratricopeptide (TPR) repeat protein
MLLAVVVGLMLLAWIVPAAKGRENDGLPRRVRYENLPEAFNQALLKAKNEVSATPGEVEPIRKLARLYHANRLFSEARACYELIAKTPAGLTAQDHYYLADIAANENDLTEAEAELKATLQDAPDYIPARLALAEALFKTGRPKEAAKEYERILEKEANQPQAEFGLARIELQRGDDDGAQARLEELMTNHPEFTSGAGLLARILERRGENDRAVAMVQWSQQKPEPRLNDPWKDALLADCYDGQRLSITFEEDFKTGRMDEAAVLLDRLAVLDPHGPIPMMFAGFSHAEALDHIKAIRDYYNALGKGGDPEKICPLLVQSLLALGKISEAESLMAGYFAKIPDSIPMAKAYAEVAIRKGDAKLARTLLEKILQKEPFLQAQNMSLAKILWEAGDRDAAAVCLRRVAGIAANDVASRALLGEYYLGKGDPYSAIEPLEQAKSFVVPKTPVQTHLHELLAAAYLGAGNAEVEKGRLAEAVKYFDKAIQVGPTDPNAYAAKANVCVQLGQFHEAAEALEKLARLDPKNPTVHLSLGDVLYQGGEKNAARTSWQTAMGLTTAQDTELQGALRQRLEGNITENTFK